MVDFSEVRRQSASGLRPFMYALSLSRNSRIIGELAAIVVTRPTNTIILYKSLQTQTVTKRCLLHMPSDQSPQYYV